MNKKCDECGTVVDYTTLECPNCLKSTFTHIASDSKSSSFSTSAYKNRPKNEIVDYEVSFFEGLMDSSFNKYVTRPVARVAYILAQISAALLGILSFVILWLYFDVANSESAMSFLLFILTFSLVSALILYFMAATRLALEAATALVQIAKNTSKP